ncbi:hypothetical protein [Aminobacter aminovorans]|uniref:hypothetical protein n=1 Tax=Aminobacter aminovorans TaxID=83263 RepID=UPI002860E6EE|nr:hypothetical protein [Aminobacter aminovorans]MDR7225396.1 hypothetical protein [Aminobacter aminovorans]
MFDEQWPLGSRLNDLAKTLSILAAGKGDPRVEEFLADVEETVAGIITGRVTGVDGETRDAIEAVWNEYESREQEAAADAYEPLYEGEEEKAMEVAGRPEKYAEPRPTPPQPIADQLRLMEIMPKYDLERFTERLGEADVEGAKAVLDKMEKAKLEDQIRRAAEAAEEKRRRDERFFKGDPFWDEPK